MSDHGAQPDSSTVPNTASNAKDHGNAPRRFAHSHHTTRATGDESGAQLRWEKKKKKKKKKKKEKRKKKKEGKKKKKRGRGREGKKKKIIRCPLHMSNVYVRILKAHSHSTSGGSI